MLKKFLKEVVTIIVGKQAEDIIDMLDDSKYMNEFIIAKKLDITINQTRNILYKISDQGLISSIRKKDKKKGWYTYFWKIEIMKSLEFLKNLLLKRRDQLNQQIKSRETKRFYVCEQCGIELAEENALLYDFTCNECGNVFTIKDNSKILKELKREVDKLDKKLSFIDKEIDIEQEKFDKQRAREIKKAEREKKKKREIAAAKRRATKNANSKAVKKKPIKRKPVKKKVVKKKAPVKKKKVVKKKVVKKKPVKKTSKKVKRKK